MIGRVASVGLFLHMESRFGVAVGWKPPPTLFEGFRHYKDTKVVSKEVPHHPVSWDKPLVCKMMGDLPDTQTDVTQRQSWPGPATTHCAGWYG